MSDPAKKITNFFLASKLIHISGEDKKVVHRKIQKFENEML
jgi:hypothetical protein